MVKPYIISVLVILLAGCQPKENKELLMAINASLEKSNELIKEASEHALREMENNHHDIPNSDRVVKLLLIMRNIKNKTDTLADLVETVKKDLLKSSNNLKDNDAAILHSLYEANGIVYNLLNKLTSFKGNIPAIFNISDSVSTPFLYETLKAEIKKLRNAAPLLPGYSENMDEEQRAAYCNNWLKNNLSGSSALMAMIVLNKLENDILDTGMMLMFYCNNQVGYLDGRGSYEKYSAIAVLSTSYVRRGQTIEVTAGAAAFGTAANPRVSIEGKEVTLDNYGVALYKFNATGKPGKHIVPVKIAFKKISGDTCSVIKNLEYTIADEK